MDVWERSVKLDVRFAGVSERVETGVLRGSLMEPGEVVEAKEERDDDGSVDITN